MPEILRLLNLASKHVQRTPNKLKDNKVPRVTAKTKKAKKQINKLLRFLTVVPMVNKTVA